MSWNWTRTLTTYADEVYHATRGVFALLEAGDLDWKPASEGAPTGWYSAGQLMRHCSHACGLTAKGFVVGEWDFGADIDPDWDQESSDLPMPPASAHLGVASPEEALAELEKDQALFRQMLEEAGEEAMNARLSKAPWGGPEVCLGYHLMTCIRHLEMHKTQLYGYLKAMGKGVTTMHLWGMSGASD